MHRLKTIWQSDLGKILISFFGLLLLLATLTIAPLITYFNGQEVTLRVANMADAPMREPDFQYVDPGFVGLSFVDASVLDDTLRQAYDAGESFFTVTNDREIYAILDDASVATIERVTLERPENNVPYLIVSDLYGRFDQERADAYYEDTGEWRTFYDGVNVRFNFLLNALENRLPDLDERLREGPISIRVRIWRGNFVIVEP